ncbi:MAG: FixG Ig-like domain-containing protein [Nanoarchaeota archaeon]
MKGIHSTRLFFLLFAIFLFVISLHPVKAEEGCTLYDKLEKVVVADENCNLVPDSEEYDLLAPSDQVLYPASDQEQYQTQTYQESYSGKEYQQYNPPELQNEPTALSQNQASAFPALTVDFITSQDLTIGGLGEFYTITIMNNRNYPQPVRVEVSNIRSWGTYRLDPAANIVINPGESKTMYIFVKPKYDSQPGAHAFKVTLIADEARKELEMSANIFAGTTQKRTVLDFKKDLELALIALIILLLIIGLIAGYDRIRKSGQHTDIPEERKNEEFGFKEL